MSGTQKGAPPGLVRLDKFVELPLDQLALAPWNYKLDDEEKVAKLINNVKLNGQVENLIVRELATGFFEVVNGNHRLDAFRRMGMTTAVCFNLGSISDVAARRIAIETNETKFAVDDLKLAALLKDIRTEVSLDDLVATMPYTEVDLKRFDEMLGTDWQAIAAQTQAGRGGGSGDGQPELCTCPKCGHEFDPEA